MPIWVGFNNLREVFFATLLRLSKDCFEFNIWNFQIANIIFLKEQNYKSKVLSFKIFIKNYCDNNFRITYSRKVLHKTFTNPNFFSHIKASPVWVPQLLNNFFVMFTHQAAAVRINISAMFSIQNPNYAPKNNADSFLYRAICCVLSHKNRQLLEQILAQVFAWIIETVNENARDDIASCFSDFFGQRNTLSERTSVLGLGFVFSPCRFYMCNGEPEQHLFFGK